MTVHANPAVAEERKYTGFPCTMYVATKLTEFAIRPGSHGCRSSPVPNRFAGGLSHFVIPAGLLSRNPAGPPVFGLFERDSDFEVR